MKAEYSIVNTRIMRIFVNYLLSYDLELRFFNLNDVILYWFIEYLSNNYLEKFFIQVEYQSII